MMAYTLPANNLTGIEDLLVYQSGQVPILWPSILFLIFMTVLGSGYLFSSKRDRGGNFPLWFAIAGIMTTVLSFVLFLINGLVNIETVSICVLVAIIGAIWLLFTKDD